MLQYYTVYLKYSSVLDLTAVQATSADEAISIAQNYYNRHPEFRDTVVTVYKAVAN
jgi:hypothetical protein